MTEINDHEVYLSRMAAPLADKLRIGGFIPRAAGRVLDVGCSDGTVTCALANEHPETTFLGIDLSAEFIRRAHVSALPNTRFECTYLRDLLARPERFDAVVFASVLHEFYSYGSGLSSVLKALADAHELLNPDGRILIRDMILDRYSQESHFRCEGMRAKILATEHAGRLEEFEAIFGPAVTVARLNHFLLKYFYRENWDRESREYYTPVSFEQYEQIFHLLQMEVEVWHSYTLPYLRDRWLRDFGFSEVELMPLRSTGILVARCEPAKDSDPRAAQH